jgi:hypothetical protein
MDLRGRPLSHVKATEQSLPALLADSSRKLSVLAELSYAQATQHSVHNAATATTAQAAAAEQEEPVQQQQQSSQAAAAAAAAAPAVPAADAARSKFLAQRSSSEERAELFDAVLAPAVLHWCRQHCAGAIAKQRALREASDLRAPHEW